jgi:hypothetical protein
MPPGPSGRWEPAGRRQTLSNRNLTGPGAARILRKGHAPKMLNWRMIVSPNRPGPRGARSSGVALTENVLTVEGR